MPTTAVPIVGGGLSGLAAALAVVRSGGRAHVFERRGDIGGRFHGDFQGLENWTNGIDVLEELASFGIEPTFEHTPFRECVFFDPDGREHVCRSQEPLWYLVRRGTEAGTLDQALKAQAVAAGVDMEFGKTVEHLPDGGIVANGPRGVDAIAVGYVFATDRSDSAFGAVSDDLAPGGYAYLLICRGRATLATCMFADFHNDKEYLARTVRFFESAVGITPGEARSFGGFGNMPAAPHVRRGNLLFAGEAAGLQDALFGFGMRYALTSGHLAGRALIRRDPSLTAPAADQDGSRESIRVPTRRIRWLSQIGRAPVRRTGSARLAAPVLQPVLVDAHRVSPCSSTSEAAPGWGSHGGMPRQVRLHLLSVSAGGCRPRRG